VVGAGDGTEVEVEPVDIVEVDVGPVADAEVELDTALTTEE